jgi:iron-sulfur cluster insertion protein
MNNIIEISDKAIDRVAELILEDGNKNLKLRVFIQGGGCSGFQYGFSFEENSEVDDFIINKTSSNFKTDIQFLIDASSSQYLQGAIIDFSDDINGQQFIINNPNAQTTCGCGSSFSV